MNENNVALVFLLLAILLNALQTRKKSDVLKKTSATDWPKPAEIMSLYLQGTMKWN